MNYPQIMSPCLLCLKKWGSCPPSSYGSAAHESSDYVFYTHSVHTSSG